MAFQSFEDLEVWKRSCQLAVETYGVVRGWRDYALKDQMQRASVSIASNIAEGCERGGKDFARFLRIAQGSASELRTQLYIAKRIELLNEESFLKLLKETREISNMLAGLRKSIEKSNGDESNSWGKVSEVLAGYEFDDFLDEKTEN